jgi:hypothetical protein
MFGDKWRAIMDDTTPQLSPAEYEMTPIETEVAPELEPEAEVGKVTEEDHVVVPDTEPPSIINEGVDILTPAEEDIVLLSPEFSPPEVEISETEEEKFIAPEETPPFD